MIKDSSKISTPKGYQTTKKKMMTNISSLILKMMKNSRNKERRQNIKSARKVTKAQKEVFNSISSWKVEESI